MTTSWAATNVRWQSSFLTLFIPCAAGRPCLSGYSNREGKADRDGSRARGWQGVSESRDGYRKDGLIRRPTRLSLRGELGRCLPGSKSAGTTKTTPTPGVPETPPCMTELGRNTGMIPRWREGDMRWNSTRIPKQLFHQILYPGVWKGARFPRYRAEYGAARARVHSGKLGFLCDGLVPVRTRGVLKRQGGIGMGCVGVWHPWAIVWWHQSGRPYSLMLTSGASPAWLEWHQNTGLGGLI